MASLTVVGFGDLAVVDGTFARKPSLYQGGRARMRDNSLISNETAEVRIWECQADFEDAIEEGDFRAFVPRGTPVEITGDLVGGETISVVIDIADAPVTAGNIGGDDVLLRTLALHIEEVEPA